MDIVKYFYIAVLHTLGFTGFWGAWVVWFYHFLIFTHQISGTTRIKFHQLSRVLHRPVEEPPISKSYMKVVCIFTLTSQHVGISHDFDVHLSPVITSTAFLGCWTLRQAVWVLRLGWVVVLLSWEKHFTLTVLLANCLEAEQNVEGGGWGL